MPPELIAALARQQITEPTPIQSAALPVLVEGKDRYLHAEIGTGKTLAYLECEERDKPDLLRKILHCLDPERALVFVHRNDVADIRLLSRAIEDPVAPAAHSFRNHA